MRKRLLIALMAVLGLSATTSASNNSVQMHEKVRMAYFGDQVLQNLFLQASNIWSVSVQSLWEDYDGGFLNVYWLEGTWYELKHEDRGSVLLDLEDGTF